ncbi:hypothetical protein N2152v2_004160 [Parachlorella kessleri]
MDPPQAAGIPAADAEAAEAAPAAASARENHDSNGGEDVVLQYVVLRRDLWGELGWPLGSVVAQGCHASTAALWLSRESPATQQYCSPGNLDHMHKVVLEVKSEAQLRSLADKLAEAGILHKLWVEQPEDFATCLATAPYPKSAVQPFVKRLKLCKGSA